MDGPLSEAASTLGRSGPRKGNAMNRIALWLIAFVAFAMIAISVFFLEQGREGITTTEIRIGSTPATLYGEPGPSKPMVVVAHGFAGSRQLMQAYSLTLARSGYSVLAFDFEGHGRNPVPMSGDVSSIDGTTALLVAETRRVLAAARDLAPQTSGVALLGHSMATDVIIRAAAEELVEGRPVDAIIAISMYSGAVTASDPKRLLVITGDWEPGLRAAALDALHLVDKNAVENETVQSGDILRRAAVAPNVEHVGVLFSPAALSEARDWLDGTFNKSSTAPFVTPGPWILLLLAGIVLLFRPLTELLPPNPAERVPVGAARFWLAIALPAIAVPLVATQVRTQFLPILVADYLALHLVLFGGLQLLILGPRRLGPYSGTVVAAFVLSIWGIGVFGFAMDRYAASFFPSLERLPVIAVLAVGAILAMLADAVVTESGRGRLWRRIAARVALFVSLSIAAALDPERLLFLVIILPVILLFLLVHGQMGRWVARRSGPMPAGLGLGLCLAWALGVSFPLFSP